MSTLTRASSTSTGIPGPASGIPRTPGRTRAPSSATIYAAPATADDDDFTARPFQDAIRANDPAQHRPAILPDLSSSAAQTSLFSGRRSAPGRSASALSSAASTRPKTPSFSTKHPSTRPSSRQTDFLTFDVGDKVRIESLGLEGCLRYVGEIHGKSGIWAGVELTGGFTGKGKNNGSVNGKQYFFCPEDCGVFVASSKLSPPTVGVEAIPRPSSVASSFTGRVAPATIPDPITSHSAPFNSHMSMSPSIPNGRVSPSSNGRATPSYSGLRGRVHRSFPMSGATGSNAPDIGRKFTAGSSGSKGSAVTAEQSGSWDTQLTSPIPRKDSCRSRPHRISSPDRHSSSPSSMPKPGISHPNIGLLPTPTKARTSLNNPRPRVPSSVAMPPPPSPFSVRSMSSDDLPPRDLDENVLPDSVHDRVNSLKFSASTSSYGRPDSPMSSSSPAAEDRLLIEQLQSRNEALEYENERLRSLTQTAAQSEVPAKLETLTQERDNAFSRISQLEYSLQASLKATEELQGQLSSLQLETQKITAQYDVEKAGLENQLSAVQQQLDCEFETVNTLEATITKRNSVIQEKDASLSAHVDEINILRQQLEDFVTEFQNEKQDMAAQIDELRLAGQETIALYEERLNAADNEKHELRNRVSSFQARLEPTQHTSSLTPLTSLPSSATEIDNETLRDQILHFQQKISTLEDTVEEVTTTSQREEVAMQEKILSMKDKEEAMKKELSDGRREAERLSKSEENLRNRIEEIEEALRESAVALENARAEVEILRSELVNLDGLVANSSDGDLYSRVAEIAQRASNERACYKEEIAELRKRLEEYNTVLPSEQESSSNVEIVMLKEENTLLQQKVVSLSKAVDDYSAELETQRKKTNREATINNGLPTATVPAKHDGSPAREIMGLKHIVQELQKENFTSTQQIKLLESENQLLASEAQQLRREVQILEDNLDQSLMQEKNNANDSAPPADPPEKWKLEKARLEVERDQLEKQLAEVERKSARTIHDLNKEISELEALVESKVYREDELEQELERTKEKLARHRKAPKTSSDAMELARASASGAQMICEICEREGHDIFNCDVLNKEAPAKLQVSLRSPPTGELFCDDCESHGHLAHDCPHSLDVF